MSSYASVADIKSRLAGRTITPTSKPSETDVQGWLNEAEAMLNGALAGAGLPAPYSTASALLILKAWTCEYAEGRVRVSHATAGGDGDNDDGEGLIARFDERLDDIALNGSRYGAMLASGAAPAESIRIRGSNADGAIEPIFTRDEVW